MKQIPLSKGKFALVDDDDFDFLSQWGWQCTANGYAARREHLEMLDGKRLRRNVVMHRAILSVTNGMDIDHINGNRLDNRKENLRICTRSQNLMNKVRQKNNTTSKYKGVHFDKKNMKWVAQIKADGKTRFLGRFKVEEDAAQAYNFAAMEYFGEFAKYNHVVGG